jgi:mannosyl-oligosaccharide alpha-1,2-mannosidase
MVGIGARIFQQDEDVKVAQKLANGCVWAYHNTPSGIMPEIMSAVPCPAEGACEWDEEAWQKAAFILAGSPSNKSPQQIVLEQKLPPGFSGIQDGKYILRPEAIESVFIMYRITGDPVWHDKAWEMFQAIETATRTDIAYAALENVALKNPQRVDSMESFWTAETLKYFYLIFSDPDHINLDEYVFNTEAHPFRRPKVQKSWWF